MRFKADVLLNDGFKMLGDSAVQGVCIDCGSKRYGSNYDLTATVPPWTFSEPDADGWCRAGSQDATCREILFGYLYQAGLYIKDWKNLKLSGVDYQPSESGQTALAPVTQAAQDMSNAFWLGLTDYTDLFEYERNRGTVTMPRAFLDNKVESAGPLFSLCSYWLKHCNTALSCKFGARPQIRASNTQTALTPTQSVAVVAPVRELLSKVETDGVEVLTKDFRRDLVREAIRVLWSGLGAEHTEWHDYYIWSKQALLLSSIGGLSAISPRLGFTYINHTNCQSVATAKDKTTKGPGTLCCHGKGGRGNMYNGILSFFRSYFTELPDHKTVERFLEGGNGMLRRSANRRVRYQIWDQ
jgi:hypothetical protein